MRALRRLLPYYTPYRWQVILGLAFVVTSSAFASVTPWLLRAALDGIRAGVESQRIWTLAGAMVGLALVAGVLRYGMRELINGLSRRIEYDLRNDLFAHLLRLDAGYFGRTRTGDIMQYDELAHHFGSTSRFALADLRRTDARIREIQRMAQSAGGRGYDLVVLSDHGMTPSVSYRVRFRESLGTTVQRILDGDAFRTGEMPIQSLASFAQMSEYAPVGARVVDSVADVAKSRSVKRSLRRLGQWVRSRYGIRELLLPEKYRVNATHDGSARESE